MKLKLLSLLLLISPLLSTVPANACNISAGDYNLAMCPTKKKVTYEYVKVTNKTKTNIWVKGASKEVRIMSGRTGYVRVKFQGNSAQDLVYSHRSTNYVRTSVKKYIWKSEGMRRNKFLTFYDNGGKFTHYWSYSAYERK